MLHLPHSLETDRLRIQKLRYEDAEEIFYAYASKLEATRYLSWPVHRTVADTNKYIKKAMAGWEAGLEYAYTIRSKNENRLLGTVGAVNEKGKIHFGYVISPSSWNKGYATEAAAALVQQIINGNDVYRIWTFVDVDNTASQKVLLKIGMVEEALLPDWFRFVNQNNKPKDCILYRWPLKGT